MADWFFSLMLQQGKAFPESRGSPARPKARRSKSSKNSAANSRFSPARKVWRAIFFAAYRILACRPRTFFTSICASGRNHRQRMPVDLLRQHQPPAGRCWKASPPVRAVFRVRRGPLRRRRLPAGRSVPFRARSSDTKAFRASASLDLYWLGDTVDSAIEQRGFGEAGGRLR